MTQGSISSSEYDRLTVQYKEKLLIYEKDIAELKSTSDYVEVQNLRNDLNYFLQHKMKQLDEKLNHLSKNEIVPDSNSPFLKESISSSNAPVQSKLEDRHISSPSVRKNFLIKKEKYKIPNKI